MSSDLFFSFLEEAEALKKLCIRSVRRRVHPNEAEKDQIFYQRLEEFGKGREVEIFVQNQRRGR